MRTTILFHNRELDDHEIWQVDKTTCVLKGDVINTNDTSEDMAAAFTSVEFSRGVNYTDLLM